MKDALPALIRNLKHRNRNTRIRTAQALAAIVGQKFGYLNPTTDRITPPETDAWRKYTAWWEKEKAWYVELEKQVQAARAKPAKDKK